MNKYTLHCIPLTAVHIGTGEEYNPMEYLVKDNFLYRFSLTRLIGALSGEKKEQLLQLSERENPSGLFSFIRDNLPPEAVLYQARVSDSLAESYQKNFASTRNQLLIGEMIKDTQNHTALLPGSSLKGAIRTALVSELAQKFNKLDNPYTAEKIVLDYQDAKSDPFRAIRITDCLMEGTDAIRVDGFINYKERRQRGDDFSQMQMFKEFIPGEVLNSDVQGRTEITIDGQLQQIPFDMERWKRIKHSFSLEDIIKACHGFYRDNYLNEYRKFYEKSPYEKLRKSGALLLKIIEAIRPEKGECLIRVGRFSQVENVTIDRHRQPWNRKGYGQTRTLTEDLLPAGYLKLQISA